LTSHAKPGAGAELGWYSVNLKWRIEISELREVIMPGRTRPGEECS